MNVGELREALAGLPGDGEVILSLTGEQDVKSPLESVWVVHIPKGPKGDSFDARMRRAGVILFPMKGD